MIRGLVLVLLATPVCAAPATMMAWGGGDVLVTGEPFTGGELASDDPNAPNTPDERAVYDCLRR